MCGYCARFYFTPITDLMALPWEELMFLYEEAVKCQK